MSHPAGELTAAGSAAVEQAVLREQAAMSIDRSRSSNVIGVPAGLLFAWLLWGAVPGAWVLAWLAAKVGTTLWRVWLTRQYDRDPPERALHWGRRFDIALAVDGAVYGCLGLLVVPLHNPALSITMTATVISIAAIGLAVLAMNFRSMILFTVPTVVPTLPFQFVQGTDISIYLGLGMMIFLGLVVVEGRRASEHTRAMLRLRFRMDQLAAERQQALDLAERSSAAKTQFLSTMSHEIRTPLNGVLGMAELLQHTRLDDQQQRYVGAIQTAGRSLHELLSDILDLAKVEEGHVQLEQLDFAPAQVLQDLAGMATELAAARGNALVTEIEPGLSELWVRGDPTRLRQVVHNLLGNANKFTEKGRLALRCRLAEPRLGDPRPWLHVAVQDSGPGISPQAQSRLFQRFEQADASTTRRYGGSGLGLAICKHLVELMGGQIAMTSTPGVGSLFWFEIPLQPASAARPAHADVVNQAPAAGARVLVAEDNAINQQVIAQLLQRLGADVQVVGDGQQAVDAVARQTFDLVLMDCQMPVMDGYEATRRIRRLPGAAAGVPVVALTANALAEDRQACLEAGMNGYSTKPITAAKLESVLQQHLRASSPAAPPAPPAAADAAPAAAPDFDPAVLAALPMVADGRSPGFARQVLTLFGQGCRDSLPRLQQACGDPAAARATFLRELHIWKSGAAQVGALALAEQAARWEAHLRQGGEPDARWVPQLEELLERAQSRWQAEEAAASNGPSTRTGG